jgi:hypothetical protein
MASQPETVGLVESTFHWRAERIWYAVRLLTMSPWMSLDTHYTVGRVVGPFPLITLQILLLHGTSLANILKETNYTYLSLESNAKLTPQKAIASPWPSRSLYACSWLPQQQRVYSHASPGIPENTSRSTESRSSPLRKRRAH